MSTTCSDQMRRRSLTGMLSVVVLAMTLGSWAHAAPARAEVTFNSKMLELVNQQRASAGVAPVQLSASLSSVAEDGQYSGCGFGIQGRTKDMGNRNYFSHTIAGCGTQGVFNMLGAAGVSYGVAGENIAWMNGTTDPLVAAQRLTNDLMASPTHKANILNPDFTHIGIGSWTTAAGQSWSGGGSPLDRVWITTQVFARITGTPAIGITPTVLAFADQVVGILGAAQTATVKNTGTAPLTVSGIALGGANAGDFSIASSTCGTVAVGSSCTIGVAFKAALAGTRSATLTLTDNAGGSPHSVTVTGSGLTALLAPGAPTNVTASAGNSSFTASWSAATGLVDGYGIYVYDANNQYTGRSAWLCASCTSGTVTGLTNGQSYFAYVYSHYALGWGGAAVAAKVTVGPVLVGPPPPVTNVVPTTGNGRITFSWTGSPAESAVDSYALAAYDANGYTSIISYPCGSCTSGTLTGLTNGRQYVIAVHAHNAKGWSAPTYTNILIPNA